MPRTPKRCERDLNDSLFPPNTGRKPTDLIEGVTPAKPADVAAHLLKPSVNTLAF